MENKEKIILGGGCFWCVEAVFKRVKGVTSIRSGYSGGDVVNPTYEQVCSGNTGHIEVIEVEFDTAIVTLKQILEVFFLAHDPTQTDRQGNDVGSQYRSIIFYTEEKQKKTITDFIKEKSVEYDSKIVTVVERLKNFYLAEGYHQNYFALNPDSSYCRYVVQPKLDKVFKK